MTGLIGAVADLISTMVTILAGIAMGIGAAILLLWTAAGVLIWLAPRLAARADRKAAELDDATIAMLDSWKDQPGIILDALDRDLARWLAEGGDDA